MGSEMCIRDSWWTVNNISPAKTVGSYTWPDSVAPSREVSPMPIWPMAMRPLSKVKRVRIKPPPAPSQHGMVLRSASRPRYYRAGLGLMADCVKSSVKSGAPPKAFT